jgi:uncharacterized protein with GYD domain
MERRRLVPTYIVMSKLTDEGVKNIRDLPQQMEQTRAAAEGLGLKRIGWYLTQGAYDLVVIVEAPDDQTMAAQVLRVAGRGNSHTETLRAFTPEETQAIIQKLG